MLKKFTLLFSCLLVSFGLAAQTDVSSFFLENAGFDEEFDYKSGATNTVKEEIKTVKGWTPELSATYTIVGTYEFGFKGTFNGANVPSKGYDGESGGGLAISTGWDQTFLFYQTVTLPAGTYTVNVPTYNGCGVTAATSQLAWIPSSGSSVKSVVKSYTANNWTLDKITFTLTKATTGKIQFGMVAASGGSANSAKLVIDYVQIIGENMDVRSSLSEVISSATALYGNGTGTDAATLKAAIDVAQAVYDNESASVLDVLNGKAALESAIDAYRKQNASEDNPLDYSQYIKNPSFEKGTEGWSILNLASQSNTSFPKKSGTYYLEKWVGSGSAGSASAVQVVTGLPNGQYKLVVAAMNGSAANNNHTGAYIYAGDMQTEVKGPKDYEVKFTSVAGEVEIGFVGEKVSSNWMAVDNFRLYLIGYVDAEDVVAEVNRLVAQAETCAQNMMSSSASATLKSAIDAGKLITTSSTDAEVQKAVTELSIAIENARVSIAEYAALAEKIEAVEASYDASKNGAEEFKVEIDEAKALVVNPDATSAELANAILNLDKALLAFNIANATEGSGTPVEVVSTNHYVATGATEALMRASFKGSYVLERGVCWSEEHNPTVLDGRTTEYHQLNGYIFHLRGLKPATVYYLRPYIINRTYEVAYGDEVKIITHPKGTCSGSWNEGAPDEAANTRCRNAIRETIEYFNQWTGIKGFHLSGNYGADTPTADCSYGGWMRIGPNAGNQAIGTVIHETGHGVGVGTHWRWYSCADTRENTTYGKWLGREANDMLDFLENDYTEAKFMTGDKTHGWGHSASYDWFVNGADKDKHSELQYLGGCCLLYALFVDGLCPTTGYPNGLPAYTYNFDGEKKYYLMNKDEDHGLGSGLIYQRNTTAISWKPMLADEAISDSAAWFIEFDAKSGYYSFKNAATGKYMTHSNSGSTVALKNVSKLSSTEHFQLMPDRTDVTVGVGDTKIKTHGYWFTWHNGSNKAMSANNFANALGYGMIMQTAFDYSDKATDQQWIIISEDELEAYQAAAVATGIGSIKTDDKAINGDKTVVGIYTVSGAKICKTQSGFNVIRYSDGSSKKIFVK